MPRRRYCVRRGQGSGTTLSGVDVLGRHEDSRSEQKSRVRTGRLPKRFHPAPAASIPVLATMRNPAPTLKIEAWS
jgi:hypothetical protein